MLRCRARYSALPASGEPVHAQKAVHHRQCSLHHVMNGRRLMLQHALACLVLPRVSFAAARVITLEIRLLEVQVCRSH